MSIEVVNLFTSSNNISYLSDELSKKITDKKIKEAVLDSLTETIFDFQSHDIIENSGKRIRHSSSTKSELDRLNNAFIEDRLAFAKNYNMYADAREYYADQMFIDDSLRPGPYGHFNDSIEEEEKRIFRYQDKYNPNRSKIPIWQINQRGHTDYNNADELRESEVSQIRSAIDEVKIDHISTIPVNCNYHKWMDI